MAIGAIAGALGGAARAARAVGGNSTAVADISDAVFRINTIVGGISQVTGLMKSLGTYMLELPAKPIEAFAHAISLIQTPVLAVIGSLKSFVSALGATGSAASEFVRLTNPVYVQKFNLAMDDLMAGIGRTLVPVLQLSTKVVRSFADVIVELSGPILSVVRAGLDPFIAAMPKILRVIEPVVATIGRFAERVAEAVRPIASGLADMLVTGFSAMSIVMDGLFKVMEPGILIVITTTSGFVGMYKALSALLAPLDNVAFRLFKLAGINYINPNKPGGKLEDRSVGAAVRSVNIGSVEDYGKKAIQAAFSLGSIDSPEKRTASATEAIRDYFANGKFIAELKSAFSDIFDVFSDGGGDNPGSAFSGAMPPAATGSAFNIDSMTAAAARSRAELEARIDRRAREVTDRIFG